MEAAYLKIVDRVVSLSQRIQYSLTHFIGIPERTKIDQQCVSMSRRSIKTTLDNRFLTVVTNGRLHKA